MHRVSRSMRLLPKFGQADHHGGLPGKRSHRHSFSAAQCDQPPVSHCIYREHCQEEPCIFFCSDVSGNLIESIGADGIWAGATGIKHLQVSLHTYYAWLMNQHVFCDPGSSRITASLPSTQMHFPPSLSWRHCEVIACTCTLNATTSSIQYPVQQLRTGEFGQWDFGCTSKPPETVCFLALIPLLLFPCTFQSTHCSVAYNIGITKIPVTLFQSLENIVEM